MYPLKFYIYWVHHRLALTAHVQLRFVRKKKIQTANVCRDLSSLKSHTSCTHWNFISTVSTLDLTVSSIYLPLVNKAVRTVVVTIDKTCLSPNTGRWAYRRYCCNSPYLLVVIPAAFTYYHGPFSCQHNCPWLLVNHHHPSRKGKDLTIRTLTSRWEKVIKSHLEVCCVKSIHWIESNGAMRGETVSTSAFLAWHQCYCVGSSLARGLNLQALVCGIFWSSSLGVFSGYSCFHPSLNWLIVQPTK